MQIRLDVYLHSDQTTEIAARLARLEASITGLTGKVNTIMATLQDDLAAVRAQRTVIDSLITLLNSLAARVAALAPDQAAIDQLAVEIASNTAAAADAVTANTPNPPAAATVPVETPV